MRVRVLKNRAIWSALLNGEEVAHAEIEGDEMVWYTDDDLPFMFDDALLAEVDRLRRYGYESSTALDRDLKEGRVRALSN